MPEYLSFTDALKLANGKKHLLLGNGFSIAWKPNIFQYISLLEQADFSSLNPDILKLFKRLKTSDFELVMKSLLLAKDVLAVYAPNETILSAQLTADLNHLKKILVNTIAANHPENPNHISDDEYSHCIQFLNNFDSVYTLNYDLLLYWVIMHFMGDKQKIFDDGFRTPDDGTAGYVTWEIENTRTQNIFYLHGALHLFDAGSELQKYTWINTGIALIEQARQALNNELYPVFVSEGTTKEKKEKINHSNYLSRALRSFSGIGGSLFVYGHSLSENDSHVLKLIPKGKLNALFVSIYGNPNSIENQKIISQANSFAYTRGEKRPLQVYFFDAATAQIWRE